LRSEKTQRAFLAKGSIIQLGGANYLVVVVPPVDMDLPQSEQHFFDWLHFAQYLAWMLDVGAPHDEQFPIAGDVILPWQSLHFMVVSFTRRSSLRYSGSLQDFGHHSWCRERLCMLLSERCA
jgi:hypothetical protein